MFRMQPFDSYPEDERKLFWSGNQSNCRQGYGYTFMKLTGQTHCAYCETNLTEHYRAWLTIALDHVVPKSICKQHNVPRQLGEGLQNFVLACAACNGFCNRYRYNGEIPQTLTESEFYRIRDKIFEERKQLIASQHHKEEAFFLERWSTVHQSADAQAQIGEPSQQQLTLTT